MSSLDPIHPGGDAGDHHPLGAQIFTHRRNEFEFVVTNLENH